MAMTNEQLTKWIDEIFGTIDEIKQNSGDISGLTRSVRQLRKDVDDLEDQTAGTVTLPKAALQHFTDGSATQALDLVADIIPVQAGTGDPSPTNVRAITGYSSVTAKTGGKNFWADGNITVNDHTNYVPLGIKFTGKVVISLTVTSDDTDADTCAMVIFYENGTNSSVIQWDRTTRQSKAIDAGDNVVVAIAFYASDNYNHGNGDTATWSNIQIEYGETATPYTAPDINTATLSLGSTVYSGYVNFATGKLYVDKMLVDLSDLTYNYETSGIAHPFFSAPVPGIKALSNGISNIYINAAVTTQNDTNYAFGVTGDATPRIRIRHSDYTDATEFKAYLSTAGAVAVVDLANPTTTTLTPAQLSLLQGENNVSATSGPITLTYAPDNVLAEVYAYIQKRFDPLAASLTANRTTTRKTTKTLTKKED